MERDIFDKNTGEVLHGARINPNKYLLGDNGYIASYSQFINTMDEMLYKRGITDYKIQRMDFRIDNYNNTFEEVYKLNNIVINLLAIMFGGGECYKSLKNDMPHNIVSRSKGQEIECYNRIAKDGSGLTKTRIELRRMFLNSNSILQKDIPTICNYWINHLHDRLVSVYYKRFQNEQNRRILHEWNNGIHNRKSRNIIDLIARNKDYICTSSQMNDLCKSLNLAKDVSYTYKNRLDIGYYKNTDIEDYMYKIVTALDSFLTA